MLSGKRADRDPRPGPDIHLDTSFLIRALVPRSAESAALRRWLGDGRRLALSTLEFLCGPAPTETEAIARRVASHHVPLGSEEAAQSARLFHATGRRPGSFQDCVVAATAMIAGADLATCDRTDFRRFAAEGLVLAG